jgi:hypothetical protein
MSIIIGSKPYHNINLNNLIDNNFEKFYRMNMATPNNNNGTKDSTEQILNCHVNRYYKKKIKLKDWIKVYHQKRKFTKDVKYIKDFFDYIHSDTKTKFIFLKDNNTIPLRKFIAYINIKIKIKKELRCGYGAIYHLLEKDIRPYIINFSLDNNCETYYNNVDNLNKGINKYHCIKTEIKLLKELHNRNFVDATFCLLEDTPIPTMDCKVIYPNILPLTFILNEYNECILKNALVNKTKINILKKELKNKYTFKSLEKNIIKIYKNDN